MDKILKKPYLAVTLLVILCAYLFLFKLGDMALTDPDETFYAQTAKEMVNKGDWTTPYLYGKPQFEKPILIYWLIEISYKIFGVNEMSARLPSALFGLIGVIAMYFLGSVLFGKKAGFLSAVILATNVEYIVLSRACITDMTLTAFMLLGVLFFFYGYLKNKKSFYILSSAAFAFAVLAKGPIAIALPVLAFIIFLAIVGDLGSLKKIPFGWCVLIFVVIAGPWYFTAYKLHGMEFIDAFFGFHNVTRFMQSEHKIGSQFYYNIPVIMAGFFPWSIFLPFGFWYIFKNRQGARGDGRVEAKGSVFALVWFFVIFLFFSASRTKLPTYVFPTFISLALIVGALWNEFLNSGKISGSVAAGVKVSYYLLAIAIIAGAVGLSIFVKIDMPEILKGVVFSSLVLVFGFIASAVLFLKKKHFASFCLIVVSLAALILPLDFYVLPDVERYESSKEVSGKLRLLIKEGEALGSQSNYLPGLAFYADKFPVDLDKHHIMVNFLNSDKRVWAVIKDKNHRGLYDPAINNEYVKPTYLLYTVGKRSIVTNVEPDDGVYILKREFVK
ncbi:MAG: glycosyltransferase family 39 protein [Candidatus Omnitrophota bacterium]